MKLKVQRVKGMKDIVFPESDLYLNLKRNMIDFSLVNNFKYIETPVVEDIKTFTLSLGQVSDVIEKEMYYLKGKSEGSKYVLRPEGTASVVRAYFENGLNNLPQPVMLFYIEKMYRKEKPQHGRLREHTQWGLEILNSEDYFADFLVIFLFYTFLTNLGIKEISVKINCLGCHKCQKKYRMALLNYYKGRKIIKYLCSDCQRRIKLNPLRLLDCKVERDIEFKENAPNILNYLCKACENHFQKVIELLDNSKIIYELDKTLVRGFDYYKRTIFEIFKNNENLALGGGGRYDLGEIISNIPLPSFGGGLGLERLKIIIDKLNLGLGLDLNRPKVFIAFTGEEIRTKAFELYLNLQKNKFNPVINFFKLSLSSQLDFCNKIGVKYALILGFQELSRGEIIFKDMEYGNQELIKIKDLVMSLKKLIK